MTEINKAEVYRKAAEIIVRDGKHDGALVQGHKVHSDLTRLIRGNAPVCALGACGRAQYELYGRLPADESSLYDDYGFHVEWKDTERLAAIQTVNDRCGTSAEDIALLLKRRAEEVEEA